MFVLVPGYSCSHTEVMNISFSRHNICTRTLMKTLILFCAIPALRLWNERRNIVYSFTRMETWRHILYVNANVDSGYQFTLRARIDTTNCSERDGQAHGMYVSANPTTYFPPLLRLPYFQPERSLVSFHKLLENVYFIYDGPHRLLIGLLSTVNVIPVTVYVKRLSVTQLRVKHPTYM